MDDEYCFIRSDDRNIYGSSVHDNQRECIPRRVVTVTDAATDYSELLLFYEQSGVERFTNFGCSNAKELENRWFSGCDELGRARFTDVGSDGSNHRAEQLEYECRVLVFSNGCQPD